MTALSTHRIGSAAAMHDLMAAELIAGAAADGCVGAQELVDEVNDSLGVAYVHGQRAKRFDRAAAAVSLAGEHDVAALIGRFAGEEAEAAQEYEAVANGLVRGAHMFGYLSDEEQRFLKRKKFEEGMSVSQAEQVYDQLLNRLFQVSANFGQDSSGVGFGSDLNAPEADEVDDGSIDAFGSVAEALGGDLPLVFGSECYGAFSQVFGASVGRLKSRQARLCKRLEKLTEKVEGLEDGGKGGPRVKALHRLIERIEKRLSKIADKLKKLSDTGKKVRKSKDASDIIQKAEDSAVRSTVEPDLDDLPVDPDALDAKSDDDLIDDLGKGLSDIEEGDDDALGAEVDVFGLTERRKRRMLKRIDRLEQRLNKLSKRRRGLTKNHRMKRLRARIAKLKIKLATKSGTSVDQVDDALIDGPSALPSVTPQSYAMSLTTPSVTAYDSGRSFVDSFFKGSVNIGKEADRQPFVCFFRRRADANGSANVAFGQEADGFFARLGKFFNTVLVKPLKGIFSQENRDRRSDRRTNVQKWVADRKSNINARRAAARDERKDARVDLGISAKRKQLAAARKNVRSRVATAYRSASARSSPRAVPRNVTDGLYRDSRDHRWTYRKSGDVFRIASTPPGNRRAVNMTLSPGDGFYDAVAQEVNSGAAKKIG